MLIRIKTWQDMMLDDKTFKKYDSIYYETGSTIFTKDMRKYCGKIIDVKKATNSIDYIYMIEDSDDDSIWYFAEWMYETAMNRNGANK